MTGTWDDRKHALHEALKAAPASAYAKALEIVGDMQTVIDGLGGKLMNAKDTKAIDENLKVRYFLQLFKIQRWAESRGEPEVLALVEELTGNTEDVYWEWSIQVWNESVETWMPWMLNDWRRHDEASAWRWFADWTHDRPSIKARLACRAVSKSFTFEETP